MHENNSFQFRFFFILFVFISIVFLILPTSKFVNSFKILTSYTLKPQFDFFYKYQKQITNIPKNIVNIINCDIKNRDLEEKYKYYELQLSRLHILEEENQKLREILSISKTVRYNGVFAEVVSRSPSNIYSHFYINKGKKESIREGAPVIAFQNGRYSLIGRVYEVYEDYSKVISITNPELSFMAFMSESKAEGLLTGLKDKGLSLNYIPIKFEAKVGEEVYTSNNSITFPGGIFIGKVMDIYKNASAMNYFEVLVQPEADINRLSYVYVIDYKPLINFGENI